LCITCCQIPLDLRYLFLNIWNKYLTNIILAMNLSYKLWFFICYTISITFLLQNSIRFLKNSPHHNWQSHSFFSNFYIFENKLKLQLKELTTKEMLAQYPVMQYLYTNFSLEKYNTYLMIWSQTTTNKLLFFWRWCMCWTLRLWSGTKLWSGKYLEIILLYTEHRKRNRQNANGLCRCKEKELGCTMIVLDALLELYCAPFYYNQGYVPKGFHFLKILNEEGLS
jgi:hypothetical protein